MHRSHRRWILLAVALLAAGLGQTAASASPDRATPPSRPAVEAAAIDPAEGALPTLPLPDCVPGSVNVNDSTDCEGSTFDYANVDANVPRPVAGSLRLSMGTRTLDFRKDADRAAPQNVTFTWQAPSELSFTSGGRTYRSTHSFLWPSTIEGGETGIQYLKRRAQGGLWNSEAEGAPFGSSSNPPRVLFVRTGACGDPMTYVSTPSCTYKVTWGDYGERVQKPLIFRIGLKANFAFTTVDGEGNADCGVGLPARCGGRSAAVFTTFRTDPPPPLNVVAQAKRIGPKQFEFDASESGPAVATTTWSFNVPAISTTEPTFELDFDDYDTGPFSNGGVATVSVKDRWNRTKFAFVDYSFLQQVGTEGPLKIKSVSVVSVADGVATLTVVVENTTTADILRAGVIAKRTPSSTGVRSTPGSATVPAKGTTTFTVTAPADSLPDFEVVSQAFGYANSSPVRSAPITTPVIVSDAPGPSCTPGTPVASAASATSVTLSTPKGTCSASGATAATGLRLLGYLGSSGTATITKDLALSSTSTVVTGLSAGSRYRFRLVGVDAEGTGPNGPLSGWALPPFPTLDSFTNRQHLDFGGKAPTSAQRTDWSTRLGNGTLTAPAAIDLAVDFPHWAKQSPMIRLYQAYFGRLPDRSGLDYWTNKSRAGTSIFKISSTFAASSEFTRKYGTLTNRQFVELVYQNVLGRPGDAGGIASWTSKLDRRVKDRGEVMVGFSESSEYQRKTKPTADLVNIFTGMLRRVPTTAELDLWKPQLTAGTPRTTVISSILGSAAYDARVP